MAKTVSLAILIPTRNRSAYLSELLSELMDQSFGKNIVVYVRDNDSSDLTRTVVESYQKNYPNLVYQKNEINIGMTPNFMMLVNNCQEDYFWLFGDDDMIEKGGLSEVMKILESNPDYLVLRDEDKQFKNLKEYVLDGFQSNPYNQVSPTLITCNIIKRKVFDLNFATTKYTSHYCHMYGIMKGLSNHDGNVASVKNNIFFHRGRNAAPPIDGDWPAGLEMEWVRYLKFIATLTDIKYPAFKIMFIYNRRQLKYLTGRVFRAVFGNELTVKVKTFLKMT